MEQSEEIQAALGQAKEASDCIASRLHGVEVRGDHRYRIPAQLFDIAIEHQTAIARLLEHALCASGFALVRCQLECFIRGAWLHYCATDEQIEAFLTTDAMPEHFAKWIEGLEQIEQFAGTILSDLKSAYWNAMNSYTHGGLRQISRRMVGEYVEGNYEDGEIREVLVFTGAVGLLAFGQIAALADRKDIWDEVGKRLKAPA